MSILKDLKKSLIEIEKSLGYDVEDIIFAESSRKDLGDFQINDAMRLAKIYHDNPKNIAEKIADTLKKDSRFINVNVAGPGFVNLTLSPYYLQTALNQILDDWNLNIDKLPIKNIFMDYGGANIAKTLHVGHLRSANIGEAVKRLAKYLGLNVISDVHFGDIGRQSGMVISEIKRRYPTLPYFDKNYKGNYEEIEFDITSEELGDIYPTASIAAKNNEKRMNEVVEITKELEEGHKAYTSLWNKIKKVSIEDIKAVYKDINVTFDLYEGETDCYPYIKEVINYIEKQGLLRESEDAKIIDVIESTDTSPMPPLVVIKSNGATLYATRDIATIYSRLKRFEIDEMWYFADSRQALYFEQIFRAVKKSNITPSNLKLSFNGFGTMNGEDGKPFKTRDGNVMSLKELIKILDKETEKRINKEMVSEEKIKETAHTIAIGALKYADLIPYRETDYTFASEKFTSLDGKTAPYILYSTIRMKSLLNKANSKNYAIKKFKNEIDRAPALLILKFPQVLTKCLEEKSLNDLTDYIYKLTSCYNTFYNDNKILIEKDPELKESWLALTSLIYKANIEILNILGINVPEKM